MTKSKVGALDFQKSLIKFTDWKDSKEMLKNQAGFITCRTSTMCPKHYARGQGGQGKCQTHLVEAAAEKQHEDCEDGRKTGMHWIGRNHWYYECKETVSESWS